MARAVQEFGSAFRGRAATPDDLRATHAAFGGPEGEAVWKAFGAGTGPLPDDAKPHVG